jgi:hypothetical protein
MIKLEARRLKIDDYVLVAGHKQPAQIFYADHYGVIAVHWNGTRRHYFDARNGYEALSDATRFINGSWQPSWSR